MDEGFKPKSLAKTKEEYYRELLETGAKPILYWSISREEFLRVIKEDKRAIDSFWLEDKKNIDWANDKNSKEFLNAGPKTYAISQVDNSNKFSMGYFPCTGLLVAGITKTGEKISFLTHQSWASLDPDSNHRGKFIADLEKQIREIKEKCVEGTIDSIIVGGQYFGSFSQKSYRDIIMFLGVEVQKVLGFEPTIIDGPKFSNPKIYGADNVFYDNEKRRCYFMRTEINGNIPPFVPSEFYEQKGKWTNLNE